MFRKMMTGLGVSVMAAAVMAAQGAPAPAGAGVGPAGAQGAGRGRAGGGAAGPGQGAAGRGGGEATAEQWANPTPEAAKWIAEAKRIAGNDPDLQFDAGVFCQAGRGASNPNRATVGVPNSEPKLTPFPAPSPAQNLGMIKLFDNFYWVGNTGIGAWIITSDDGYIVYDAMNNAADARDLIVPAMQKGGLDPKNIKYIVFGHYHGDHTGGGRYLQRISGAKAVQHWSDWELYQRMYPATGRQGRGGAAMTDPDDATPMTRDIDATNGMEITVGNREKVTAKLYLMSAHTPGSMAMILPVRYRGQQHPILIVTAGNAFNNINAYIGAYEYVFSEGRKAKVESVMQAHPNTNMNMLARTKYIAENYAKMPKHPLLYGAERTSKYLDIVEACSKAFIALTGQL